MEPILKIPNKHRPLAGSEGMMGDYKIVQVWKGFLDTGKFLDMFAALRDAHILYEVVFSESNAIQTWRLFCKVESKDVGRFVNIVTEYLGLKPKHITVK